MSVTVIAAAEAKWVVVSLVGTQAPLAAAYPRDGEGLLLAQTADIAA
jgi:hypothetical protein